MVKFKAVPETPDGLDPVFDAYQFIKRVFAAAQPVDPEGEEEHTDGLLQIPGSGEIVDADDANVLNQLERWLAENTVEVEE